MRTLWLILITLTLITLLVMCLIIQYQGFEVLWFRYFLICIIAYSPFLLHWFLASVDFKDIISKPERFLKLLIYVALMAGYGSGLALGGQFWVFTIVSANFFLVMFVSYGSFTHPECFRRWSDLRKINNKVVWDSLKI